MHRVSSPLRVLTAALIAGMLFGAGKSGRAQDQSAWKLLWSNQFDAAQSAFQHDVSRNPKDADALRGLGWTSYYRDDQNAALNYWSRSIALAPDAWTSTALWPMVTSMAEQAFKFDATDAAARAIIALPHAPAGLKLSARVMLIQEGYRAAGAGHVDADHRALGLITDWRVIGPFDNVSTSGFDKVFAPEADIRFGAKVAGKEDLMLQWRHCPLIDLGGMMNVAGFIGDETPDVFYAASSVESPSAVNANIALNMAGASKIYVNGVQVFADSVSRTPGLDMPEMFSIPVHLQKGWNSIVVKMADDDHMNANFQFALLNDNGLPVSLSAVDSSKADGTRLTPAPSAGPDTEGPRATAWITGIVGTHVADVEGALLLADDLEGNGDHQAAENILQTALKSYPDCAPLYWELSEALTADGQGDEGKAALAEARKRSHNILQAELTDIANGKSAASEPEHVKQLRRIAHRFPASDSAAMDLAGALQSTSSEDEAYRVARQAYNRSGSESDLMELVNEDTPTDKQPGIDALLKRIVQASPRNTTALSLYGDNLSAREDYQGAIRCYTRLMALEPATVSDMETLAGLYQSAGDAKKALHLYAQVAADRPQNADTQVEYAKALENAGDTKAAIDMYTLAIALDPSEVSLRDKLQLLTGQKPILDMVPAQPTPDLDKLRGKSAAGAPSMVDILDEAREVVYPDFSTLTRFHEIVKVNDDAAVTRMQEYALERNASTTAVTVESARLIKADGKIEDRTEAGSDASVSFPSLAPGDIIDVTYRAEDHFKGALAHEFWAEWFFGGPEEQDENSRFVLITPTALQYETRLHNGAPAPTEKIVGAWRIRQWDLPNGTYQKEELMSPPTTDWVPWVDISTIKSWSQVVQWYEDLAKPRCIPDAAVRAKAAELTKGATTDDDKIRALYHYVSHDIQYQSTPFRLSAYVPTEGKKVIRERYGDCKDKAALLTALLESVGISSRMVLLSPHEFGVTEKLPSPRFAHAIALVDAPGGPLWVDGTTDGLPYRQLPVQDQGVPALVIRPETTELAKVPYLPQMMDMKLDYKGKLSADGSATLVVTITADGPYSWLFRGIMRRISADKENEALRGICAHLVQGAKFDSGSISGVEDADAPVVITISAHNDHFATPAGSFLMFGIPWDSASQEETLDAALTPGRVNDLDLSDGRNRSSASFTLEMPDGYIPQDLKPSVNLTSPWETDSFTYHVDGNTLTATTLGENNGENVPAAEIGKFQAYVKSLTDEASAKIVLKKQ